MVLMKMSRIKIALLYLLILFFCSCGARKAETSTEKVVLVDKGRIEMSAPGVTVEIPLPAPLKERPKRQTKVYPGEFGAKGIVTFDDVGIITNILCICPEVKILKQENLELKSKLKDKKVDRKASLFQWLILAFVCGFIIALVGKRLVRKL